MKHHTLIRRTQILAALWLLALAAIASADRAEGTCPLSSQQACPAQQDDGDCSFDIFQLATVPVRLHNGSPGGLHDRSRVEIASLVEVIDLDPPRAGTTQRAPRDVLSVAPKTSPPLFA